MRGARASHRCTRRARADLRPLRGPPCYAGVPFVSASTLTALVQDVLISLACGGVCEIIFVNGHYTNIIAHSAAITEVGDQLPRGQSLPVNYWDSLLPDELGEHISAEVGLRANIGETSAVLAVDESLVKLDLAVREYPMVPVECTGGSKASALIFTCAM